MNVIVFDTETVGVKSQALLNVGYKVVDINPSTAEVKELCKRDYIVRKHFQNEMLMINDMFVGEEKYMLFKQNIENGGAILRTVEQIFSTMANDIAKHKVTFGYAYNCDFDTDKFTKTADQYGIANPIANIEVFDLWAYAYQFICNTPDYIAYCKENELLTETQRYIKTSVEGVTAFLNKDKDFVEEHTALSDVEWELRILQEVIRRGCDITKKLPRAKFIPSGKVFTKTLIINGESIEVNYTKMSKSWDKADTIRFINETK